VRNVGILCVASLFGLWRAEPVATRCQGGGNAEARACVVGGQPDQPGAKLFAEKWRRVRRRGQGPDLPQRPAGRRGPIADGVGSGSIDIGLAASRCHRSQTGRRDAALPVQGRPAVHVFLTGPRVRSSSRWVPTAATSCWARSIRLPQFRQQQGSDPDAGGSEGPEIARRPIR